MSNNTKLLLLVFGAIVAAGILRSWVIGGGLAALMSLSGGVGEYRGPGAAQDAEDRYWSGKRGDQETVCGVSPELDQVMGTPFATWALEVELDRPETLGASRITDAERKAFERFEAELVAALGERSKLYRAATCTTSSKRQIYLYVEKPTLVRRFLEDHQRTGLGGQTFRYHLDDDPGRKMGREFAQAVR